MRTKTSPILIGCLIAVGTSIVGMLVLIGGSGNATKTGIPSTAGSPLSSTPSPSSRPENSTPQEKLEAASQWTYSTDEDSMGRERSTAYVKSTNTLSLNFPYQGSQNGTLIVRKSPQKGTNVYFSIEKGQFLCRIDECTVNVRFDTRPIQQFSASEPSDHSTTVLFIANEARFLSQMRKAKMVRIEATVYQGGSQTLEFNVGGFKWQP